jgi:hypothetical protein
MKVSLKSMLLSVVVALSLAGCDKANTAMPLTQNNVTQYRQQMEAAIKATTPQQFAEINGNPEKQKKVMYHCFIAPVEKLGFSYDKTISDIADKVLAKDLQTPDSATTEMVRDMLVFAKNARETELKHGFITQQTKGLLDKVSQIFPS